MNPVRWLTRLLHRDRLERELDAELRYHFDRQVQDNIRDGLPEAEAQRRARLEFGGIDQTKEACRDARGTQFVENVARDLRLAVRGFNGTTALAVLCLALGIGGTATVFSVMYAAVLRPLPLPDAGRVVRVMERHPVRGIMALRPANFQALLSRTHLFSAAGGMLWTIPVTLDDPTNPLHLGSTFVTQGALHALGVEPELGRLFATDAYNRAASPTFFGHRGGEVLISDRLWRREFSADPAIIGQTVTVDAAPATIVGVMPASFAVVTSSDIFIPWVLGPAQWNERKFHDLILVGRLKPGGTRTRAQHELTVALSSLAQTIPEDRDWTISVTSIRELAQGSTPLALLLLLLASGAALLLACINVGNLLLAQAVDRQRAIGIRMALGASAWRLLQQALTEGGFIVLLGTGGGLLLAWTGIRLVGGLATIRSIPYAFAPALDGRTITFTIALGLISTLVACLPTAVQSRRVEIVPVLSGTASWKPGGRRLRAILIIVEAAVAFALLTVGVLMARSLARLGDTSPGLMTTNLLLVDLTLPETRYPQPTDTVRFVTTAIGRFERLPGVISAGATTYTPLTRPNLNVQFDIDGRPASTSSDDFVALPSEVTPGFLHLLGIPLLRGRAMTASDEPADAPDVAVVSQTAARRYWPDEDPIGHRVRPRGFDRWFTIVGIVGDSAQRDLSGDLLPAFYLPFAHVPSRDITLVVRTSTDPRRQAPAVQHVLHDLDPLEPIDRVTTMDTLRDQLMEPPAFRTSVLIAFTILATLLAGLGLYGVLSENVLERRHELGIRLALGATPGGVVRLVLRQVMTVTAIGLCVGLVATLALRHLLASQLFGVSANDPASLAMAAALLLAVALVAAFVPARRAAATDPLSALRQE